MVDEIPTPPSNKPTRKVMVGVAAGAFMTIVAWASKAFANVEIPADVALAGSTVLVFVVQYFIPDSEV